MWYFRSFTFSKIQYNKKLWIEGILKEVFCAEKKKECM